GCGQDRRCLPCLARDRRPLRRRARLLQIGDHRRDRHARPCPDSRPLCRNGRGGRRRRAVLGKNGAPDRSATRADGRRRPPRRPDCPAVGSLKPMTTFTELMREGVLTVGDGYRAKNEELGADGPIFLRSAYLQDNGWVLNSPDRLMSIPGKSFGSKIACVGDTVLTTKGNSLGRLGFVDERVAGANGADLVP